VRVNSTNRFSLEDEDAALPFNFSETVKAFVDAINNLEFHYVQLKKVLAICGAKEIMTAFTQSNSITSTISSASINAAPPTLFVDLSLFAT